MQFLKTKEQILLKLNDYSDPAEKGLSKWSPCFIGLDVMYSCGSGKEFRLNAADVIYTFFNSDPRGKLTGVRKSSSSAWSYYDTTTILSYESLDLPDWYCYCFIRSPERSDYCNLLKIYYSGRSFSRDYIKKHIPESTMCVKATPSKLQIPGLETLSPVILHPPHESVTPSLAMKGITNIP